MHLLIKNYAELVVCTEGLLEGFMEGMEIVTLLCLFVKVSKGPNDLKNLKVVNICSKTVLAARVSHCANELLKLLARIFILSSQLKVLH